MAFLLGINCTEFEWGKYFGNRNKTGKTKKRRRGGGKVGRRTEYDTRRQAAVFEGFKKVKNSFSVPRKANEDMDITSDGRRLPDLKSVAVDVLSVCPYIRPV